MTQSKTGLSLLVALFLMGNAITIALLVKERSVVRGRAGAPAGDGAALEKIEEAIASLSAKVDHLSSSVQATPPVKEGAAPAVDAKDPVAAQDQSVLEKLSAIEKQLTTLRDVDEELAAAKLREEREKRFQSEDGYMAADELLAEKKFALAGNGYLKFLEHHADHPDTHDLLGKARDAFMSAGYAEKAMWIQNEMMKKFPETRDQDLMALAIMEKDSRRFDDAIQHAEESAALARNGDDRLWRLLYRAWFLQLRDGDAAGLQAYREVEGMTDAPGMRDRGPGKRAREKVAELEERLAQSS